MMTISVHLPAGKALHPNAAWNAQETRGPAVSGHAQGASVRMWADGSDVLIYLRDADTAAALADAFRTAADILAAQPTEATA